MLSKCYSLFKHKALDMEYCTAFGGSVSQAEVQLKSTWRHYQRAENEVSAAHTGQSFAFLQAYVLFL